MSEVSWMASRLAWPTAPIWSRLSPIDLKNCVDGSKPACADAVASLGPKSASRVRCFVDFGEPRGPAIGDSVGSAEIAAIANV